jgi:hypothetical protein
MTAADIDAVWLFDGPQSYQIARLDPDTGLRLLLHFTSDMAPAGRVQSIIPFLPSHRHGTAQYSLRYHFHHSPNLTISVTNPSYIMLGSHYWRVDPDQWLAGHQLADEYNPRPKCA